MDLSLVWQYSKTVYDTMNCMFSYLKVNLTNNLQESIIYWYLKVYTNLSKIRF